MECSNNVRFESQLSLFSDGVIEQDILIAYLSYLKCESVPY